MHSSQMLQLAELTQPEASGHFNTKRQIGQLLCHIICIKAAEKS
jgi:hypothetical protein